jgi:hypothetical protein
MRMRFLSRLSINRRQRQQCPHPRIQRLTGLILQIAIRSAGCRSPTHSYLTDCVPRSSPMPFSRAIPSLILPPVLVFHRGPSSGATARLSRTLPEETIESIAAEYEVDPETLYNEWNELEEGRPLYEGQLLVVPDGIGGEIVWTPPEPESPVGTASYSYGVCSGVTFTGPGANGWFVLPTGSPRVSGWYFRDPRNPGHIGLDYA